VKKPGKPKPKRRGRPQPVAAQPVASAIARAVAATPAQAKAQAQPSARALGIWGGARDERMALTLLLLPVILVAAWLTLHQSRRADRAWGTDVAINVPSAPQGAAAVVPSPSKSASMPVASTPRVDVQSSAAVAPAPVKPAPSRPVEIALSPLPAFPPPVPDIPRARIAALDTAPAAVREVPTLGSADGTPSQPLVTGEQVCAASSAKLASFSSIGRFARAPQRPRLTGIDAETFGRHLAAAAIAQTRDLVIYSARYQPMAYPMGDVVALQGACIDVVIRAYRELGIDLQELVQRGRPSRGDTNIDHRRTENMRRFLERNGASLPVTSFPEDYKPGDIVTYHRPFSRVSTSHIAVVTGVLAATGRPMIVHNRGYGAQLEDALFVDRITGHYRYMGGALPVPEKVGSGGEGEPMVRASLPVRRRFD
jgi:uncharacterized protein